MFKNKIANPPGGGQVMNIQYICRPNRQAITSDADRSILAPSPCGEGWGGAIHKGRGDLWRTSGSRGDPPAVCEARGDPPWMYTPRGDPPINTEPRGDPPELIRTRGHPPEIRNARDGPTGVNGTRGKPPEMKTRRHNSFKEELVFRILAGPIGPHGRGMPGREGIVKPLSGCKTTERVGRVERKVTPSAVLHPEGGYMTKKYKPETQFSHLFNSYAQAYNKRFGRTGSLFQHPFKRKLISHERYLKHVILYIHNNPVHHGFCSQAMEYPWSSYLSCISIKPTKLKRDAVIGWFDSDANFKNVHNEKIDFEKIEKWLGINE
ncbi:MAG: hypothetical protein Q8S54_12960 [Bacteroidota bacterium]|nr:hypothetical protein [Bacteroidota bacterium]